MIKAVTALCERCRRPIPTDAPGGLCPNCLFSSQLSAPPSTVTERLAGSGFPPGAPQACVAGSLQVNMDLGPYRLLEEIGRGGMGIVYRARHQQLDRLVAIKMILAGSAASPRQLDAFLKEAKTAARVRHPNVVGIHEVGQVGGCHFMVMELVEGKSLLEHMRTVPFEPDEAARIIRDVAGAVLHLHDHGIIHRDIKPSNILLDADGIPYVTDFGLAKVRELSTGMTSKGLVAGTPRYMSPEQATGAPERLAPQTDVYSLGAVFYELLAGRPPFRGKSIPETLLQVLKREPEPPGHFRHGISRELDYICLKCLEKNPSDRYPDMAALSADLDRYLDGEAVSVKSISAPQRIRRWWRTDPALAARDLSLWLFFSIEQVWFHALGVTSPAFYLTTTTVVPLWALVSHAFAYVLRRSDHNEEPVRSLWITTDMTFLTALLLTSEGLQQSPLVMLYPIYIVCAAMWSRVRAVWLATALCVCSDLLLWLCTPLIRPERAEPLHVHMVFAACLMIVAIVVSHQVRQVRLMRRYIRQHQPSPHPSDSEG